MTRLASVLVLVIPALSASVYGGAKQGVAATPQAHPTEDVLRTKVYSDNMMSSGRVADYTGGQALVFAQNCPLGRCSDGVAMNFNVPNGGPVPSAFLADNCGLGNGFWHGDALSAVYTSVFRGAGDPGIGVTDVHVHLELWDGDPFGWYDTPATGFLGTKIAGSDMDFTIPANPGDYEGHWVDLYGEYDTPVVASQDRAWLVIQSDCCRLSWSLGHQHPDRGYDDLPDSPTAPQDLALMQADLDGYAPGYGECCYTGGSCNENTGPHCMCYQGADYCPQNAFGIYDQCSDGDAESQHWFTTGGCTSDPATTRCANFQIKMWAATDNMISLIPTYADTIGTTTSDEWTITDNRIDMVRGGRGVWLEWYVSDWDPPPWTCMGSDTAPRHGQSCVIDLDDPLNPTGDPDCPWTDPFGVQDSWCGIHLKAWQVTLDSRGYSTGLQGTLTPAEIACVATAQCTVWVGNGSACAGGTCEAGFMDQVRADYVFNNPDYIPPSGFPYDDLSTLDYRWGATLTNGVPVPPPQMNNPPRTDQYLGTLVVNVPSDAKGTFEIDAKPVPDTVLLSMLNVNMPKLGIVPGIINVEIGQCCFGLGTDGRAGCIDGITADQCASAGLCHGTCSTSGERCITDDECPQGETCSGVCTNDGTICWSDDDCTPGATCDLTAGTNCLSNGGLDCPPGQTCVAQGDYFLNPGATCQAPPCFGCGSCLEDSSCDDDDACTDEYCDLEVTCACVSALNYDPATECCTHPTGDTAPIDDNNPCTVDICSPYTGEAMHYQRQCVDDADCSPGLCIDNVCVCLSDVSCCLPDDTCAVVPAQVCGAQGGFAVDACLGDSDFDGADDICRPPDPHDCCLPDGTCVAVCAEHCYARRGGIVSACLGDGNGDGYDDACEPPEIPVASAWGMLIMLLVLAALAKIYFGRCRNAL